MTGSPDEFEVNKEYTFVKNEGDQSYSCTFQIMDDGSAYVRGDEFERIYEEKPNAWRHALEFIKKEKYSLSNK